MVKKKKSIKKCKIYYQIEETTHGFKVLNEKGTREKGFFNKKKEAKKFVKDEGACEI